MTAAAHWHRCPDCGHGWACSCFAETIIPLGTTTERFCTVCKRFRLEGLKKLVSEIVERQPEDGPTSIPARVSNAASSSAPAPVSIVGPSSAPADVSVAADASAPVDACVGAPDAAAALGAGAAADAPDMPDAQDATWTAFPPVMVAECAEGHLWRVDVTWHPTVLTDQGWDPRSKVPGAVPRYCERCRLASRALYPYVGLRAVEATRTAAVRDVAGM